MRFLKTMIACMILLFTFVQSLLYGNNIVSAEENNVNTYADGEYDLPFTVLHATQEVASMADQYFTKPGKVIIQDGKVTAQLEYSEYITEFTVNGENANVIKQEAEKTVAQIPVQNIEDVTEAEIHVVVPTIGYDHWYTVRFDFETTTLPLAEIPENLAIEDGHYTIAYDVWKDNEDVASSFGNYLTKPAELIVENNKAFLVLTISSSNFITGLKTELNGQYVDAEILHEDTDTNQRIVKIELENINKVLNAQLAMSYGMTHTVRFVLNESTIAPYVPEEETPGTPEEETPGTPEEETPGTPEEETPGTPEEETPGTPEEETPGTPEEETPITTDKKIVDGTYQIPYSVLNEDQNGTSMADRYFIKPGTLVVENGQAKAQITFDTAIQEVKVNGVTAHIISENDGKKTVEFAVEDVYSILAAEIHVVVAAIGYDHWYPIGFDFDTSDLPVNGTIEEENNNSTEENNGTEEEKNTDTEENESKNEGNEDGQNGLADGEYVVDYSVLHATKNEASMADSSFIKPGKLIVKNGDIVAQLEIKKGNVTEVVVNDKPVAIVSENDQTFTIQFPVNDPAALINGKIHVVVPAANYDHWYDVRFQFDTTEFPISSENDSELNGEEKEETTNQKEDDNTSTNEDNLEYDRNSDNENTVTTQESPKVINAKTGDFSQIALYALLLVGSMVVLIRKYRMKTL